MGSPFLAFTKQMLSSSSVSMLKTIHSYKLEDDGFADLTNNEFTSKYLGFRRMLHLETEFSYNDKVMDTPKSIDWRKKGAVTRIKDQGECGKAP